MKIVLLKKIFFFLCFIDLYSSLSYVKFEEKSKNLKINEIKNSNKNYNIRNLAYNAQSSSNDTYPLLYTIDKNNFNISKSNTAFVFKVTLPPSLKGYLFIEIDTNSKNPILLLSKFGRPYYMFDPYTYITDADTYDFIGYYMKKNYHYTIITQNMINTAMNSPNYNGGNLTWYFSLYSDSQNNVYNASVKISIQSNFPCPNSCGSIGNNYCYNGQCKCPVGLIDEDCSTPAHQITMIQESTDSLIPNKINYFYYDIPDNFNESLILKVKKAYSATVKIYVSFENFAIINLPTTEYYLVPINMISGETDYAFIIEKRVYRGDNYNGQRKIYFGVLNASPNPSPISLSITSAVTYSSQNDIKQEANSLYLVIIATIISLVLLILLLCLCRYCIIKKYSANAPIPNALNLHMNLNPMSERRKKEAQLTIDIVASYLKEISYKEYIGKNNKVTDGACAVCLEDFTNEDLCRESICNHIFHKNCLDSWLIVHENCPYCRTSMKIKDLEDHFTNKLIKESKNHDEIPMLNKFEKNNDPIILREPNEDNILNINNIARERTSIHINSMEIKINHHEKNPKEQISNVLSENNDQKKAQKEDLKILNFDEEEELMRK